MIETLLVGSRVIVGLAILYEIYTRIDTYRKHRILLKKQLTGMVDTVRYIRVDMRENKWTTLAYFTLFSGIGFSAITSQDSIITAIILIMFGVLMVLSANARREKDKIIKNT